jgi:2-polyprenyl-3-methyl-5-hydroxy-6-metoxy-1,4-benzoquinol methylase
VTSLDKFYQIDLDQEFSKKMFCDKYNPAICNHVFEHVRDPVAVVAVVNV